MSKEQERMTQEEVAEYFGVTVRTVQRWRADGVGPAYLQYPGRVMYLPEDLQEYNKLVRISPEEIPPESHRRAS